MNETETPGKLIVVEGPDGAGKTVLCVNLANALRDLGHDVLEIREPGGCELSEHLRGILKGETLPGSLSDPRAEALLFAASRAQLVSEVIRPALADGKVVLCDRWIDSSVIYQGIARGLGADTVREISVFATGGLNADLILSLQVSKDTALSRRTGRDGETGDRIEESLSAETIREGYNNLKSLGSKNVVEICAEGTPNQVLVQALGRLDGVVSTPVVA